MSVDNVSAVRVTSTLPPYSAFSVLVGKASYRLSTKPIGHGDDVSYDLNNVKGLNDDSIFTGRIAVLDAVTLADDNNELKFVSNVKSRAIYSVSGSANAPSITYGGTEAF